MQMRQTESEWTMVNSEWGSGGRAGFGEGSGGSTTEDSTKNKHNACM